MAKNNTIKKKNFISLRSKLLLVFFSGMAIALLIFWGLYSVSSSLLDDYFANTSFLLDRERECMTQLQEYVEENQVTASDSWALKKWAKENDVIVFTIVRDSNILYNDSITDNSPLYGDDFLQTFKTWQFFYQIRFADGEAYVYVYKNYQRSFYLTAVMASAAISAFVWALFLLVLTGSKIKYVRLLQQEILLMKKGELEKDFTERGNDELSDLSGTLNEMHHALTESKLSEKRQKEEQETLLLGMAHDLRTPLTGLLGFLELCRRNLDKPAVSENYLEKAIEKTAQIRDLSDKLFDFFLSNEKLPCALEQPAKAEYVLGDYLSEFCSQLTAAGFSLSSDGLFWPDASIRINNDFLGRIMNNLSANLEKYADKSRPVSLSARLTQTHLGIQLENCVKQQARELQGTRIGIHNITKMMEKMNGTVEIISDQTSYSITLLFPLYQSEIRL